MMEYTEKWFKREARTSTEEYIKCVIWAKGELPEQWNKSILTPKPKKGDLAECNNYRTISLKSHMGKVMMKILTNRLGYQLEEHMADEQAGAPHNKSSWWG
jgi:hypothetical protein